MSADKPIDGNEDEDKIRAVFEKELVKLYEGRSRKPQWTKDRICDVIRLIEEYKAAPALNMVRNSAHYHYAKRYDVIELGDQKFLILKRKSVKDPSVIVVPSNEYYDILTEIHRSTKHGGRDKMLHAMKSNYFIPTPAVIAFVKLCTRCQNKREYPKKGAALRPLVQHSKVDKLNTRGQVDLIDMRTTPDKEYKWILHYQDHTTRFSFLRPLITNKAAEVAFELLKIFLEIGAPNILQNNNKSDFITDVITELSSMWSSCKLVGENYRFSESHEYVHEKIVDMLQTWMQENNSNSWATGIYFIQFQKNCTFHQVLQKTPFKALFGVNPKNKIPSHLISNSVIKSLDINETGKKIDNDFEADLNQPIQSQFSPQSVNCEQIMSMSMIEGQEPIQNCHVKHNISSQFCDHLESDNQMLSLPTTSCDDENIQIVCAVCGNRSSTSHSCFSCDRIIHSTCGIRSFEGVYESLLLCNLCQNMICNKRKMKTDSLFKSAKLRKDSKIIEFGVGCSVLVDIPKANKGFFKQNITGKVLEKRNGYHKIGTSVGILKDWLPRNAIQLSSYVMTDPIPEMELTLKEICLKLSTFSEHSNDANRIHSKTED